MKKLLLSLLFVCGLANSTILATLQNRAGGLMYFTDSQCARKNDPYWKIVYSTLSGGQTIWGCWFYSDGMVHVQWDSGDTSAFDARELNIRYNNKGSM